MTKIKNIFPRGAEWRQWDLHIHTPASFHWNGARIADAVASEKIKIVDEMIKALNDADPAVFALMDYWTFDGWFALKDRLKDPNAPPLTKMVFPGIELRLVSPTKCRLNAHVIFSNEINDQSLLDFRSALEVELIGRPLSDQSLIDLARTKIGADKLKIHSFNKEDVDRDDSIALRAGSTVAEIKPETYKEAISKVPNGQAIGFMPYDTSDGLDEVDWKQHYSYFLSLLKSSPIFETRNADLRGAFIGEKTPGNAKWFVNFQNGLDNIPRLAVAGSDAHRFSEYGKYPSGKATWIKADPTFLGLLQAIKEPSKRSFIGESPPKLQEVAQNKTYYIDAIKVDKNPGSPISDYWLSDCSIPLNTDLVAIIGNKGSGKSALADVIALLGNTRQKLHLSFLSGKRFRQKPKELAKHFTGTISWRDSTAYDRLLSENPPDESVELVRYIPQAHFENLCNEHVSGQSDAFETELRSVIFSYTSASIRQKALDFNQLIDQQERSYRDCLGEYRKDLRKINQGIEGIETQLQPEVRRSLQEQLTQKQKEIEEHKKIPPLLHPEPSEQLTPPQQKASEELERISGLLKAMDEKAHSTVIKEASLAAKTLAIQAVRERLHLLERQYKQFKEETASDFKVLELDADKVVSITINEKPLDELAVLIPKEQNEIITSTAEDLVIKTNLVADQEDLKKKLNAPQQIYQQSKKLHEIWQEKTRELVGTPDEPDTLEGVKARILQLDQLPNLLNEKQDKRLEICGAIFDTLEAQRNSREELFKPVQELIQSNSLIRDEYKLQFQSTLGGSTDALASRLFELIKQNSGEFRGEEESHATVIKVAEKYDLNKKDEVLCFVSELHKRIVTAANPTNKSAVGIASVLRSNKMSVNKTAADVYDLLFGLPFLEPRYSLLFQDTHIEQLSPGQRGALLLIFYLLVDKGRNPIVLDQPEENLDNETIVSLLVPVICEAKRKRQIIMVTHNPNLAVVCDAEQVVYSSFDRKNGSKIEYASGSIESPQINSHVVNVLEGTKPAFDNRRIKYH